MIQEQISTSSPKCLDGNSGFGIVAQTAGMAPNVAREVSMLSGYTHQFAAGDNRNPVAFLHVVRRTGGINRHIVSRVADCGSDYSNRTNRIAHHWIIEELDLSSLSCGPTAILSLPELFRTQWNEKPQELPRDRKLPNPLVSVQKCTTWEQMLGDAGWGGVLAERAENGNPVSVIFEPGMNILPMLAESFALLPPNIRWKLTFSTFFMKSQEPPGNNKVQIKCILAGTDEEAFAMLTPNTLVLDLRLRPATPPVGKYVDVARTGIITTTKQVVPLPIPEELPTAHDVTVQSQTQQLANDGDIFDLQMTSVGVPIRKLPISKRKLNRKSTISFWIKLILVPVILITICAVAWFAYDSFILKPAEQERIALKAEQDRQEAEAKAAAEKAERERQAAVEKAERERQEVAAAEKTEQERQEAEAKAAAEKAERERQEVAAAEKTEQERKETEEKKRKEKITKKVESLKDWCIKQLPCKSDDYRFTLPDTKDFWEIKESVSIEYLPFVDLKIKLPLVGQLSGKIINFEFDDKKDNISDDKILLGFFKKFSGSESLDVSKEPVTIASFYLERDKGIIFEWDENIVRNYLNEPNDRYNRILLANLKIIVGNSHTILPLFTLPKSYKIDPVTSSTSTGTSSSIPKIGQSFNTWEGGYLVQEKDRIIIEVQNGQFTTKTSCHVGKYILELPQELNDEKSILGPPLQITYPEWKYNDETVQGALVITKDKNEIVIKPKVFKAKIKLDSEKLKKELKQKEKDVLKFARQHLGFSEKDKFREEDTIQTIDSHVKNNNFTEWSSVKTDYTESKKKYDHCDKLLGRIADFEKGPFSLIPFSIYLQRYDKPEEKLLLLEVTN